MYVKIKSVAVKVSLLVNKRDRGREERKSILMSEQNQYEETNGSQVTRVGLNVPVCQDFIDGGSIQHK